jgi:predicted site-specific integrase-resolvase
MEEYVSGSKATKILGVHQRTLYQWDEKKWIDTIRTPGGKRLYNVKKYLASTEKNLKKTSLVPNNEIKIEKSEEINLFENKKRNIIYGRVSSSGQKDDLERQILALKKKYPNYELITDIGSGMNLNRKGLRKIIDISITGNLNEVVVVHKDRLCRFGFDLIEDIINKYSNGKITIIDKIDDKEPQEELVEDVLQIMNIFVAKMNGLRKYNKI